jgi:hypothetical protein
MITIKLNFIDYLVNIISNYAIKLIKFQNVFNIWQVNGVYIYNKISKVLQGS